MYEDFYNFGEKPFTLLPDPSFLFLSKKHLMALTMLEYGLMNQSAGITVISGEIGSGKTTLIRHLLNEMEQDLTVGLITNTHTAFGELLQWVLMAFDLEYKKKEKVELYEDFVNFVIREYANNKRTVLIIDEAQNMQPEKLEELRMLSNINADKNQVLQLILVGQPELLTTLQRPDLQQFAQRISVSYHLEALGRSETKEYIHHRIKVANGDPRIFEDTACDAIWYHSRGVPRVINTLCDMSLVYGFAEQQETINFDIVNNVVHDKKSVGLFPGRNEDDGPFTLEKLKLHK